MPICWRCKKQLSSTADCDGWVFLQIIRSTSPPPFGGVYNECREVDCLSDPPHVQLKGLWVGLCDKCKLTESQIENMYTVGE